MSAKALALSSVTAAVAFVAIWRAVDVRQALLFAVGLAAGVTLYHAAFGFTTAFRVFVEGRGAGIRAQMLMLALAAALFIPLIGRGEPVFGEIPRGASTATSGLPPRSPAPSPAPACVRSSGSDPGAHSQGNSVFSSSAVAWRPYWPS